MSHGRTDRREDWLTLAMKEDQDRLTLRNIREERVPPHVGEEKAKTQFSKSWWQFWKR